MICILVGDLVSIWENGKKDRKKKKDKKTKSKKKKKTNVIDFEVPGFPTKKAGTLFKIQITVTNKFSFKFSFKAISSSI